MLLTAAGGAGEAVAIPNLAVTGGAVALRVRAGRARRSDADLSPGGPPGRLRHRRRDRAQRRGRARDRAGAGRRGGRVPGLASRPGLVPPGDRRRRRRQRVCRQTWTRWPRSRRRCSSSAPTATSSARRAATRASASRCATFGSRPARRRCSWWFAPTPGGARQRATTCARAPSCRAPAPRPSRTTTSRTRSPSRTAPRSGTWRAATWTFSATRRRGSRCWTSRSSRPRGRVCRSSCCARTGRCSRAPTAVATSRRASAARPFLAGPVFVRVSPRRGAVNPDEPYRLTITSRPPGE